MTDNPNTPYTLMAELGHVLSSPVRLRIIHLLCQCDRTVDKLAEVMKEPVANVSHHLQLLQKAHLVSTTRIGRHVAYGIAGDGVRRFWQTYRDFAGEALAELQVHAGALAARRGKRGGTVDRNGLAALLKSDAVIVIDVRPREEYDAGHLPGALSWPLSEILDHIPELPAGRTVVIYCRGPYCLLGDAAQEQLAARSIHALRLDVGVVDWVNAGLPVRRSPGYKPLVKRPDS
jgi:rhodanese-related sulfurtransferase